MKTGSIFPLLLTLSQVDWKCHSEDRSEYVFNCKYCAYIHSVWM